MVGLPEFVKKLLVLGQLKWEGGAFLLNGERAVIFRAGLLVELQRRLEERMGRGDARKLMKDIGREQSRSAFERYMKSGIDRKAPVEHDEKKSLEDPVVRAGRLFLETTGWGKFNYLWFRGQKRAVVEVENSPIALAFVEKYGKSDGPVCHFTAGLLEGAGFLSGMNASYVERACAAQQGGVSKKCVFEGTFHSQSKNP